MKHPDLNLMIALDILLEEGSVNKAAERMHLSAPAMSRTLTRIRAAFNDPILVRAGRNLVPTPRALTIQAQLRTLVQQSIDLFDANQPLDLQRLNKTFTLRANESFLGAFETAILNQIATVAPLVQLRFVAESDVDDAALREGRIELFIGARQAFDPEIKVQRLFDSHQMGLARSDHPIFQQPLTPERYAAYDHISISRRGRAHGPIDIALDELGLSRHIPLIKPNFLSAAFTLCHSDFLMTCPEELLPLLLTELPLRSFAIPLPLKPVQVTQAWHPRFDNVPAHQWFRQLIKKLCVAFEQRPPTC
ncbi:MAG: LysR family transcriptional regulator [Neisseriaceae bacterium]|nr:LysR family transcriptional regulator [Neisseriaceae bacterium]MBP6862794.1 LysR family transcriptional regulator [Neisseriaceae bacterium]